MLERQNLLDGRAACPIPQRTAHEQRCILAPPSESRKNRFPLSRLRVSSATYREVQAGLWRRENDAENSTGLPRRRCYVLSERQPGDSRGVEYHAGLMSEAGGMRHGGERTATY